MMWRTPRFWYEDDSVKGYAKCLLPLLKPLGALYGLVVRKRFDLHYPVPLARPVVCIGNLVAGGAGKTPLTVSLVKLLQDSGENPHILTRGYGGAEEGPLQVSPMRDTFADVGDEALLLVDAAPVWVSKNRPLGAQAAIDTGASVIVMDDGFQNPAIYKNFSLIVIDGGVGFGNGLVFPAGPLREDIESGLNRADAVVIVGEDKCGVRDRILQIKDMPVFSAMVRPDENNPDLFSKPVYAFAGIGRPQKFKDTLIAAGAMLEGWSEFPDHYAYIEEDLKELMDAAEARGALIVTTAKDFVRLPAALQAKTLRYSITVEWQDADLVVSTILAALEKRTY